LYELYEVVKEFEDKIEIVYKRFESNLGGVSLTKQWERCIALSIDEPYIWLFSDDDEMAENSVRCFYNRLEDEILYDVYRFNLVTINESNDVLNNFVFKGVEKNLDFFKGRITDTSYSCITQYIFSRRIYNVCSGFVEFPNAWFSDDASIIKFSSETGIMSVSESRVYWRLAIGYNITTSQIFESSWVEAEYQFTIWFNQYFKNQICNYELKKLTIIFFEKRFRKLNIKYILKRKTIFRTIKFVGMRKGVKLIIKNIVEKSFEKK